MLDEPILQPYIHDVAIKLCEGRSSHTFRIFFKRHRYLPINRSVSREWRGDLAVVRVGKKNPDSIVNLRSGDAARVEYIVKR